MNSGDHINSMFDNRLSREEQVKMENKLNQAIKSNPETKNIKTPLEKAVAHLLKIGSTNKHELEEMAEFFITDKAACEKVGLVYENWLFDKFAKELNGFKTKCFDKDPSSKVLIRFSEKAFMHLKTSKAWLYSESITDGKLLGCNYHIEKKLKTDWEFNCHE